MEEFKHKFERPMLVYRSDPSGFNITVIHNVWGVEKRVGESLKFIYLLGKAGEFIADIFIQTSSQDTIEVKDVENEGGEGWKTILIL